MGGWGLPLGGSRVLNLFGANTIECLFGIFDHSGHIIFHDFGKVLQHCLGWQVRVLLVGHGDSASKLHSFKDSIMTFEDIYIYNKSNYLVFLNLKS